MDRVPQFWSFLSEHLEKGNIKAPKLVYEELTKGKDELVDWCKPRKTKGMCISPNKNVQDNYKKIATYIMASKHSLAQKTAFLVSADGWVIAHAMADGGTVVSLEITKTTKTTIKIPNICKEFGVKCIDTFDMLEDLDFKT